MKAQRLTFKAFFTTVFLMGICFFFALKADAKREDGNTKLLVPCSVQSGDTITQIGNTCSNGGNGCTANPCNN
jgi:preprotein translocase subunit YajC